MPEDMLVNVRIALKVGDPTGRFYCKVVLCSNVSLRSNVVLPCADCPRGHIYFIGNVSQVTHFNSGNFI